jgi:hypothetical protein
MLTIIFGASVSGMIMCTNLLHVVHPGSVALSFQDQRHRTRMRGSTKSDRLR